jgi:SAM-dependent methyltransferase
MAAAASIRTGIIGGRLGYAILRRVGARAATGTASHCTGAVYQGKSKLEVLFGPDVWAALAGKTVMDIGCAVGIEAIEAAQRGAARVIGIDIREDALAVARRAAAAAGVADRCVFTTRTDERADVILSVDGFEHDADPEGMLRAMREHLDPRGRVLVAFGPPWFHPLGGHLFSVFPWAHLVFTERALIRWRADFKTDGATCFRDTAGGLNQMTVRRFRRLVERSDFAVERFEALPIRRLRRLATPLTREVVTSMVRCTLVPKPVAAPRRETAVRGQEG